MVTPTRFASNIVRVSAIAPTSSACSCDRNSHGKAGRAVTIAEPPTGTFEAQLAEDEFHMLWVVHRNRRNSGRVQILLSAALQTKWRITSASPEERAILDQHGFERAGAVTHIPTTSSAFLMLSRLRLRGRNACGHSSVEGLELGPGAWTAANVKEPIHASRNVDVRALATRDGRKGSALGRQY